MEQTGKIYISLEACMMTDAPRAAAHVIPTKSVSGSGSRAAAVCRTPQETNISVRSCLETSGLRSPKRARLHLPP